MNEDLKERNIKYEQEFDKLLRIIDKIKLFLDETNINIELLDYTDEYLEAMNDQKSKALKEYGYKKALVRFIKEFDKINY